MRVASAERVPFLEVSRSKSATFDMEENEFSSIAKKLALTEDDWVVNCIGWIPQKAFGIPEKDFPRARALNSSLPAQISDSKQLLGFNWIQIGTDCVFSGAEGGYSELSRFDANDLYGTSKIEGEQMSEGDIRIRCSIIGPSEHSSAGLFEWFRSQSHAKTVRGFKNHFWNGVSSHAFAKLVLGLFHHDQKSPFVHHWIPSNSVSKHELLEVFANNLQMEVSVDPVEAEETIDRTLQTTSAARNLKLWRLAGYEVLPSIDYLCKEFISIEKNKDFSMEEK